MTIQFEIWHLLSLAALVIAGFWAVTKVTANLFQRSIDTQFVAQSNALAEHSKQVNLRLDLLDNAAKADTGQWQRVERELLNLKADLPLHYVRREDYVQAVASIMAKLDAMALRFENILLRGNKNHE